MRIGVIKEIKDKENRVALTPDGAREFIIAGHSVAVEKDAGLNSGYPDQLYEEVGCLIAEVSGAWNADMILKIKEPLESEYRYFTDGRIIFTYFYLAGVAPSLTQHLLDNKVSAIAYETVRDDQGGLPLLAPMSGVASLWLPSASVVGSTMTASPG